MSDSQSLKQFAEELNDQRPIDLEKLAEAFDQVFYEEPKGSRPLEDKHIRGFDISSVENVGELVEKLEEAREAKPDFVRIGDKELEFDSNSSLDRLIDGIRIGIDIR
jgi:hypothetical protein